MRRLTRRKALVAGAAGAPLLLRAAPVRAGVAGDAGVLTELLRAEHVAERLYATASTAGPARVRAIAGRFGAHETEHVRALGTALEALGAPKPAPPRGAAAVEAAIRDLGLRPPAGRATADDLLGFLLAFEQELVERWVAAHGRLEAMNLVQTATQVLGCQAQHAVALRRALGRDRLPEPLDAGR